MKRRNFIKTTSMALGISPLYLNLSLPSLLQTEDIEKNISDFCRHLSPVGRILETKGYYVWCNTPVYDKEGKVHVFYSRWPDKYGMGGWIHKCEIAHAIADSPEEGFKYIDTMISPRPGCFDATTCHNPHIQYIDDKYYLFYMGNSNGKTSTKKIGMAVAEDLNGKWQRTDNPILETGRAGSWDDHCTTNPALVKHPDGEYWLYYKSWNTYEYEHPEPGKIRGNRKYGLAIAKNPEGPYIKYKNNPVIDFSGLGGNEQLEDAFVWYENGKFILIARDMGFYDHKVGLYFESEDGIKWQRPEIAYKSLDNYVNEAPAPAHLKRYGRVERPQILFQHGKPAYLFTAAQGGSYQTSSGFVFKINE